MGMNSILQWVSLVAGMVIAVSGVAVAIACQYVFLVEELTQGAFMKRFWFESIVSVVLLMVGMGLVMVGAEKKK